MSTVCSIDFGTNSATAWVQPDGTRRVDLEAGCTTMLTSVLYVDEGLYG